jgi:hypothetical protein
MRSRRRAHLGGRSFDGTTQAILARRQLEQGDSLSHRTFRLLQVTQLRSLGVGAVAGADEGELAFFSDTAAEAAVLALPGGIDPEIVTGGTADMLD